MKQAVLRKGTVTPGEVAGPKVSSGAVLIRVISSCLSAGTEGATVATSGKSIVRRALEQPEKVKQALNMVRSEGLTSVWRKVNLQFDAGKPIGYSLAGIVVGVGAETSRFRVGDRVAAAGTGFANHAEFVDVPENLVTHLEPELGFQDASTVALGSIAMQGVRRLDARMGDVVVVFGVGLVGLLVVRMLSLSGVRVVGVDFLDDRLSQAQEFGAEWTLNPKNGDLINGVKHLTGGQLADGVVFCAATSDPTGLEMAFQVTRKKGRVVMVGVWGDVLNRDDIYSKELDFLISTSYGPGRGDERYEIQGQDYPYAYVRWTEGRNMQEYLRLLSRGSITFPQGVSEEYSIDSASAAFARLSDRDRPLLVFLNYGDEAGKKPNDAVRVSNPEQSKLTVSDRKIRVGLIGVGAFTKNVHLPNFQTLSDSFSIHAVCSRQGLNAKEVARQYQGSYSTTDPEELLKDPDIDLVWIGTRHNLHGSLALRALESGKNTFVEKPLCLTSEELESIRAFFGNGNRGKPKPVLIVGFNRRFSPYLRAVREAVQGRINPVTLIYTMNAGFIPSDQWVHGKEGGGRALGEGCHVIDLFSYLVGSPVASVSVAALHPRNPPLRSDDNRMVSLEYDDGSIAGLHYFSGGSNKVSKERLEVHFDEKSILVDDYRSLQGFGVSLPKLASNLPEKGHLEEMKAIHACLSGTPQVWPIPLKSLLETSAVSIQVGADM